MVANREAQKRTKNRQEQKERKKKKRRSKKKKRERERERERERFSMVSFQAKETQCHSSKIHMELENTKSSLT
jgi:hypothetical protein